MNHNDLVVVADYIRRELVGKEVRVDCGHYIVDHVSVHNHQLIFEGRDFLKKGSFKVSYVVDEQGELHTVGANGGS